MCLLSCSVFMCLYFGPTHSLVTKKFCGQKRNFIATKNVFYFTIRKQNNWMNHSVMCSPLSPDGSEWVGRLGGVKPLTKFSKGKSLTGSQFLEGVAGNEERDFFGGWGELRGGGVVSFYIKNKLILKYLTTKKCFEDGTKLFFLSACETAEKIGLVG